MRRRSGGLHCSSQQQYVELADVAQQCNSLFYDEPKISNSNKRRKYAFSQNVSQILAKNQVKKQQKPSKPNKIFQSFNFDQQSHNFEKDMKQLKKIQENMRNKTKKTNFTILSNQETHKILKILQKTLGVYKQIPLGPNRAINLCVHRYVDQQQNQLFIDCYWIIDTNHVQLFGSLFKVYTEKSQIVVNLDLIQNQETMIEQDTQTRLQKNLKQLINTVQQKRKHKIINLA